ncbi:MAG: hypothetical protein LGR52_09895 [Candidatus Thiosymbion ectosymbiont of Robbea hypermnestra]|nr:hypothetical protein [Candidatus Thiosymbion ectosymbiont of Robbea hypermnestra]
MLPFSLTSFLKYLIGVLLVQGVTVLLVVTAYRTDLEQTGLLFLLLNLAVGALTALWFTSLAAGARKQALSRAKEGFAREREKIRVHAERAKTKEIRSSRQQASRELRRVRTGGNLKTGLLLGGAAGLGTVMVLTQFVTLGLLTLTTAGGAAVGYGLRARRERLGIVGTDKLLLRTEKPIRVLTAPPAEPNRRKRKTDTAAG